MDAKAFSDWGWRIPFLVSAILLVFSVYIRLRLDESPIFQKMKEEGKGSKAPLTESFLRYPNNKYVLLALLGATAGMGVVWYTGQFYALFFLTITLKLGYLPAYLLILACADHRHAALRRVRLAVRSHRPAQDHPGRLSDRGADLLPAVRGADALRQPGPRGVLGPHSGDGYRRRFDLRAARLRDGLHQVLQLRPRPGPRHQARRIVQDRERAQFGRQGELDDRPDHG